MINQAMTIITLFFCLLIASPVTAAPKQGKDKIMQQMEMMDQMEKMDKMEEMDRQDLQRHLDKASACLKNNDFTGATENLNQAGKYSASAADKERVQAGLAKYNAAKQSYENRQKYLGEARAMAVLWKSWLGK